jgi:hypothetical protein
MTMITPKRFMLAGLSLGLSAGLASAEPMFLSKQYARCTTCHYSPTGGGLLTPYGRSLARHELSTLRKVLPPAPDDQEEPQEAGLLKELSGDALGPIDIGVDLRPAHLNLNFGGGASTSRNLLMNADLLAAYRVNGWTFYGEIGREPLLDGLKIGSYEYWAGHESDHGLGFRAGRFLPAYGLRLADHTAFTRRSLGLDSYDQIYGVELSYATERQLLQVSIGPGFADAIIHNTGRQAFTTTARVQSDLGTRSTLVVSGRFQDTSTLTPRSADTGVAFGIAPTPHLTIWTEGDVGFRQGTAGAPAYTLLNETSVEVYRGLWIKLSPQLRTFYGDLGAGSLRMVVEADLLPRASWNLDTSYYWDRDRQSDLVIKTFLLQLHLYL